MTDRRSPKQKRAGAAMDGIGEATFDDVLRACRMERQGDVYFGPVLVIAAMTENYRMISTAVIFDRQKREAVVQLLETALDDMKGKFNPDEMQVEEGKLP
jgi:hypothetical protein